MSLSWRERLLISLAPGELSWVRLAGLFKPEVRAKRIVPIEHGYGTRSWDGVIAALHSETAQWARAKLAVRIVLSNHFVRYALVPKSDGVNGHEEELALARFHFSKVHGEASRSWDIRLSPAQSGGARLACAVDTALIDALRHSFSSDKGPRLASVQPLLMSVFNSGSPFIPDAGAWLIMAEPDRACVALLKGRTWHAVQNVKGRFADAEGWISLVERERWRVNLDVVPNLLLIHSAQTPSLPNRTHGAWKVIGLQTPWPAGLLPTRDSAYVRALSAA